MNTCSTVIEINGSDESLANFAIENEYLGTLAAPGGTFSLHIYIRFRVSRQSQPSPLVRISSLIFAVVLSRQPRDATETDVRKNIQRFMLKRHLCSVVNRDSTEVLFSLLSFACYPISITRRDTTRNGNAIGSPAISRTSCRTSRAKHTPSDLSFAAKFRQRWHYHSDDYPRSVAGFVEDAAPLPALPPTLSRDRIDLMTL